ncbi:ATP-grasp domain-containing protein [Streptomyces sp. NPDC058326]|uniref:ATP-grasp domain-containing protein n=1 Tax=Streptomyces sp. NPDC058326 TaxID=3346447 RepID=UPI0036EDD9BC
MHIILIETTSVRGFDIVKSLAESGVEVTFVADTMDFFRGDLGYENVEYATRVVEVPGLAEAWDLAERLEGAIGPVPPDGVICRVEDYLPVASELARTWGLPHDSLDATRLLADKDAVRARLAEHGIGSLRWRGVRDGEEGMAAVRDIGLPVVIKPAFGGYSVGVSIAWTEDQARAGLALLFDAPDTPCPKAVVEEYAFGRHVSAEIMVQEGEPMLLGFTEQRAQPPGVTAEMGRHFPAVFEGRGRAGEFALDAVRAVGIRNSAVHMELVITPTGPELIEINGRMAGHVVTHLISRALDRSVFFDLVALATGERLKEVLAPLRTVALRHLWSETAGTVASVEAPAELPPGTEWYELSATPGSQVSLLRNNWDRIGYLVASGENAAEACETAETAAAAILNGITLTPDAVPAAAAVPAPVAVPASGGVSASGVAPASGVASASAAVHASGIAPASGGVSASGVAPASGAAPAPAAVPGAVPVPSSPGDAGSADRPGGHLLLLLDGDGNELLSARALAAAGVATGRVSVVWTGPAGNAAPYRARWERQYLGRWRQAAHVDETPDLAREIHRAEPVTAVLALTPGLARHAEALRAEFTGTGTGTDSLAAVPAGRPPYAAGHVVLSFVTGDDVRHLGIADVTEQATTGTTDWTFPSALPEAERQRLLTAAGAYAAGCADGVVQSWFPADGDGIAAEPVLRWGLTEELRALFGAGYDRDAITVLVRAAAGGEQGLPARRPGHTRLRVLTAPAGHAWTNAPAALETAYAFPEVCSAAVDPAPGTGRLLFTVTATGTEACAAVADRVTAALGLAHEPTGRTHVLLVDRTLPASLLGDDGEPLFPADRYRLTLLGGPATGSVAPAELAMTADVFDDALLTRLADTAHAVAPVDRVVCLSERLLEPAARLRHRFGTPGDPTAYVRSFRDKALMKQRAAAAGIRHARGHVLHSADTLRTAFDRYGAVVVKPRSSAGSRGVSVLRTAPAVEAWLRTEFVPGVHLVEEYVDGAMCHIDAVVQGDFLRWDVSAYRQDTLSHTRGAPLSSVTAEDGALRAAAGELLGAVVRGWGVEAAVLHLEAFWDGSALTFCEVAARPGGGGVLEAFRATRGIDLDHAKLLIDAGEDVRRLAGDPVAGHAGWTVHYAPSGVLRAYDDSAVGGAALARRITARVGDTFALSGFAGTGLSTHVFADDSADKVARLVESAERDITIVVDPR